MDKITHEARLNNWKHIVEECNNRPHGVTVKQWLNDNAIFNCHFLSTQNA